MPGGGLVVLDRLGRDVKRYSLGEGMATLGSDTSCDIQVLLPSVSGHHATVAVRPAQTIVRNVSDRETLVNGRPVSVAALRHGDVITLGDRSLRWEYDDPAAIKPADSPPTAMVKRVVRQRGRRRVSDTRPRQLDPAARLLMEMKHRNSVPANGGGKQVAVVQPQRRDNHENIDTKLRLIVQPHRPYAHVSKRRSNSKLDLPKHDSNDAFISEKPHGSKRKTSTSKPLSKTPDLQNTTKATLWIESRKTSPRKSVAVAEKAKALIPSFIPRGVLTPNLVSVATQAKKSLVTRVAKIQAPSTIDHTKQAALMLITGHSNKSKTVSPSKAGKPRSKKTPQSDKSISQSAQRAPSRRSKEVVTNAEVTPNSKRSSRISVRESSDQVPEYSKTKTILETSDSDPCQSRSRRTVNKTLPSPRKSAMKDPRAKKGIRKTESIKFDLSNLDNYQDDNSNNANVSDIDSAPQFSDSSQQLSRKSRRSTRSSSTVQEALVSSDANNLSRYSDDNSNNTDVSDIDSAPQFSDSSRTSRKRSIKSSTMVQEALVSSDANNFSRYSDRITRSVSDENSTIANITETLSPRSPKYTDSVVDLVSIDSNESRSSVYNSIRSESTSFGTPKASSRRTRSNLEPSLIAASTPYVGKTPNKFLRSTLSSRASKRSKSVATPARERTSKRSSSVSCLENDERQISNSTRLSRASSRTLNDSEILILSANEGGSSKTSKRSSRSLQSKSVATPARERTSKRSSSVSCLENDERQISNSTRLSRASSRSLNDSLILLSPSEGGSPETSKRNFWSLQSKSVATPARERTSKRWSSVSCLENDERQISNRTRLSRASSRTINDSEILILSDNEGRSSETSKRSSRSLQKSSTSIQGSPSILNPKSLRNWDRSKLSSDTSKISVSEAARVSATNCPKDVKSPRVPNTKSPRTSFKSPFSKANKSPEMSSSETVTETSLIVPGSPVADGLHTPDNAHSPQDQGTPVLNIQSLLNSSDSSLHLKSLDARNSQSAPRRGRSGTRSKSLDLNVNRQVSQRISKDSSNASDRTDKEAPKTTNEKTITPKSTVKLSPVAVKGKHSTAKKPQSKRLLIDDMEDSDIVKSFFSSPVKRKLSQSMTEFSRTQLFEDDVEPRSQRKRPRRASLYIGQLDLNGSEAYTPEGFVSTLETSTKSPNVSGVKKSNRNSKRVLTRDSISLPLQTRKSPRNRLSDFRGVKEIFTSACSPKNDLRRVSGVKSLFQTKRTRNSPKNDLTDVRGVKRLYQEKSPINDLRNISGLKKTITRHSPTNDLHDVRGVKRLFTRDKSKDGLDDLSGVEELFDTSFDSHKNSPRNQSALQSSKNSVQSTSENVLDQFIGKPRAKATYARRFPSKPVEKENYKRSAKTRTVSVDQISNNVEEWLEKESVTVSKVSTSKRRQSINTFETSPKPIARELANLATYTVEGSAPVSNSRIRMGIMTRRTVDLNHSTPIKDKSIEIAKGTLALARVSPIICLPEVLVRMERLALPSFDVPLNILASKRSARATRSKKIGQEISYTEKLEDALPNRGRRNGKERVKKPETKINLKKATRGQTVKSLKTSPKKVASPEASPVKKFNTLKITSQGRQLALSKTNKKKVTVAHDLTSRKPTRDQETIVTQERVKNMPSTQGRQIRATKTKGSVTERLTRQRTNSIDQQISEEINKPKRRKGPLEEKCEKYRKTEQIQNATQKVKKSIKRGRNALQEEPQTQLDLSPEVKPKRGRSGRAQIALKEPDNKVQKRNANTTEVEIPTKTRRGTKLVETTKVTRSGKSAGTTKGVRQKRSVQVFETQTRRGQNVEYTETRRGKKAKEDTVEAVLTDIKVKNEPGPSTVKVSARAKRAVVAKNIGSPTAPVRSIRSTRPRNAGTSKVVTEQAEGDARAASPVKRLTRQRNAASKATALPR